MAFVNEYIAEADFEKYDLRRICGERNLARRGHMHARDWTVDHERETFLISIWTHRESEFEGLAFYWRGGWMFFERTSRSTGSDDPLFAKGARHLLKGFAIPVGLNDQSEEIVLALKEAFSEKACGGVYDERSDRKAFVEFIAE